MSETLRKNRKLDKLFGIKVFPIALAAPFGLVLGPASIHIPLPCDLRIQVLDPACLDGTADDAYNVEEHYRHITDAMQAVMTRLSRELRGKPN